MCGKVNICRLKNNNDLRIPTRSFKILIKYEYFTLKFKSKYVSFVRKNHNLNFYLQRGFN